ncbi:MAG: 30S ribosomal protein S4 [Candidatus Levybacteria bacterium]|nr:30S ribosomal protein S4 [Candidatus Levybacteria bacterium]
MGKYTGPKHRLARREGINVLDKQSASLQRRLMVPPGIHGKKGKRRLSEFGRQLREKQKAKVIYGMYEKQFKRLVKTVEKQKGDTSEKIIALLEMRLDNVVYRLGFANSRFQARQFVGHGHVLINGRKMTIPSYQVKEGDVITLSEKMQKVPVITALLSEKKDVLPFLDRQGTSGKLVRMPKKEDVEVPFNTQQIIEYYSR